MAGAKRMDKTHPMAESFSEAKSTLDQVFRFYKWRRHAQSFPEEVYLLLSRCMYVCFSLWRSDQENQGDFFRRSPPPTAFWIGVDFAQLQGSGHEGSALSTDAWPDRFTNDTKWFDFWMRILEQSDPRAAPTYREFSRHILTCVGRKDLLDVRMGYRNRKALDLFLKKDEAGRVLLRTIAVLEDLIQAIVRYFATLDGRTCILEKVALLTGFLSEMRQILVWETPAKGPYSPSRDARWRGRSPLRWLSRDRTPGVLTVIPRREGGEILCVCTPASGAKGRRASWVCKVASLKGTYEEALFATWSYDTGEHRTNPQQFPGVTAGWTVQYAEAQHLEALARQIDLLLASFQGNPRCQRLVEAVRGVLRNGASRWKATVLPWTYVRQLDQLLEKLISVYREAGVAAGGDAAERVVARVWASEETTTGGAGPSHWPAGPGGEAALGAASPDMTLALGKVKRTLPKADRGALDQAQPSFGSEQLPVGSPAREDRPAAQSPEAGVETAAEKPPEEPDLSEQRSKPQAEAAADRPPEDQALGQGPEAEMETAVEKPPEEPELSEEDFQAAGPAPVREDSTVPAASDDIGGQERPPSAAAAPLAGPTETDAARAAVPTLPEQPASKPAPRKTTNTSHTEDIDEALLRRLLEHHGCLGGTIHHEPLSPAKLQRDLRWNSSKLQRAMTHVFGPKPVNVYRAKCKDRTIATFLKARAADMVQPVACDTLG